MAAIYVCGCPCGKPAAVKRPPSIRPYPHLTVIFIIDAAMATSIATDAKVRFVQDRVALAETHLADLCSAFASYARKEARLRDKGDALSNSLGGYGSADSVHRSLSFALASFAADLAAIEDHRQAEIDRMETKVVRQLSAYETICKMAKDSVKATCRAREKQLERQRQLQKIRDKGPSNRQQISEAESELRKAMQDATQTLQQLEDQTDTFEKKKLLDIKRILTDFIHIELIFHSKAVELLTQAYGHIQAINISEDLEEFRNYLRLSQQEGLHEATSAIGRLVLPSTLGASNMSGIYATPGTSTGHSAAFDTARYSSVADSLKVESADDEEEESDESDEDDDDNDYDDLDDEYEQSRIIRPKLTTE